MNQATAAHAAQALTSKVGFHGGGALSLAASQYPRLVQTVQEGVQNGIDEGATVIEISIDRKRRSITIRDNGAIGVTRNRFESALAEVARSQKARTKLGRFGVGAVSYHGKCREFAYTTRMLPEDGKDAWRWTFNHDVIQNMAEIEVPLTVAPRSQLAVRQGMSVPYEFASWTTEVRITDYTQDRSIGRLDIPELQRNILVGFGAKMRKTGTQIVILDTDAGGRPLAPVVVRATDFLGRPLDEVKIRSAIGETQIRLFVVKHGKEKAKGEVGVGTTDNDFRIPFKRFARQAEAVGGLPREVVEGFATGIFEGEILHSALKLLANREEFNPDDAFLELCTRIEVWYDEKGKQFIEKAQDQHREERLQRITQTAEEAIAAIFKQNEDFQLAMGKGLRLAKEGDEVGTSLLGSSSSSGEPSVSGAARGSSSEAGSHEPRKPSDAVALGGQPQGEKRRATSGGPKGLKFMLAELESTRLWELSLAEGTLTFNTTHPVFLECERNELALRRLEEISALYAIGEHLMPAEERRYSQLFFDKFGPWTAALLLGSPSFVPGLAKKKALSEPSQPQ